MLGEWHARELQISGPVFESLLPGFGEAGVEVDGFPFDDRVSEGGNTVGMFALTEGRLSF